MSQRARRFLVTHLDNEQKVCTRRLQTLANKERLNERTLQRAAAYLEVKKETEGFGKNKRTYWILPKSQQDKYRADEAARRQVASQWAEKFSDMAHNSLTDFENTFFTALASTSRKFRTRYGRKK